MDFTEKTTKFYNRKLRSFLLRFISRILYIKGSLKAVPPTMIFKDGGYIMTKKALLDHEKFNNSIKKSRIKQELLAERLDISVRHVRNLRKEDISISASLLYNISQEFQKPMEYFLTFDEEDEA